MVDAREDVRISLRRGCQAAAYAVECETSENGEALVVNEDARPEQEWPAPVPMARTLIAQGCDYGVKLVHL